MIRFYPGIRLLLVSSGGSDTVPFRPKGSYSDPFHSKGSYADPDVTGGSDPDPVNVNPAGSETPLQSG